MPDEQLKVLYDINQYFKAADNTSNKDSNIPREFHYNHYSNEFIYSSDFCFISMKHENFRQFDKSFTITEPKLFFKEFNERKKDPDFTFESIFSNKDFFKFNDEDILNLQRFTKKAELIASFNSESSSVNSDDGDIFMNYSIEDILGITAENRKDNSHLLLFLEFDIENNSIFVRKNRTSIDYDNNFFLILDTKLLFKVKSTKKQTPFVNIEFYDDNNVVFAYGNEVIHTKLIVNSIQLI